MAMLRVRKHGTQNTRPQEQVPVGWVSPTEATQPTIRHGGLRLASWPNPPYKHGGRFLLPIVCGAASAGHAGDFAARFSTRGDNRERPRAFRRWGRGVGLRGRVLVDLGAHGAFEGGQGTGE